MNRILRPRRGGTRYAFYWLAASMVVTLAACSGTRAPDLRPLQREIDLDRFMGRWYVLAHIPIDTVFASEANAYNAIEEYELEADGSIATTFTFREGSFEGEQKQFHPTAFVYDERTKTEWRMQFVWPIKAPYLILYVDEDYRTTLIGVPDRSYAWIMARTPEIAAREYDALVERLAMSGHDLGKLRRVPHRWD